MSLTLAQAREALAEALSAVDGLTVQPRPTVRVPKRGDGWVTVGRMVPADFTRCSVTLTAVVVLGADEGAAEELLETLAVQVVDAVTTADDFPAADVALEPISLVVESGATLHALTITMTTEVSS